MSSHEEGVSTHHLDLILFATFLFGFITGAILFLQTRDTGEGSDTAASIDTTEIKIIAQSYGGCERTQSCPSYTMNENGAYTFVSRNRDGEEISSEDVLTEKQLESLNEFLANVDLVALEQTRTTAECPISQGGAAERYTITYKGKTHNFDSCKQDIMRTALFMTLRDYFVVFTALYRT